MPQVDIAEREVLSFLTRAWSEDQKAQFRWCSEGFHADTAMRKAFIMHIRDKRCLPDLEGFDRWRYWRYKTFHEAMHLKLSPRYAPLEFIKLSCEASFREDPESAEALFRILEDERIERLGLETYLGYLSERDWETAYCYSKFNPDKKKMQSDFDSWMTEFFTRMLYSKDLHFIRPEWESSMSGFVERGRRTRVTDDIVLLVNDMVKWLKENIPRDRCSRESPLAKRLSEQSQLGKSGSGSSPSGFGEDAPCIETVIGLSSNSPTTIEKSLESLGKNPSQVEAPESLKTEYARIVEAGRGEKDADEAVASVLSSLGHGVNARSSCVKVPEVTSEQWDGLVSDVGHVIEETKSRLRKWQVGWQETPSVVGDDLDSDALILSRFSESRDSKVFLDEERISNRGKVAILLDMSGSISGVRTQYLQSAAIVSEALAFIRSPFELCAFSGGREGNTLWLLKVFKEPWGLESRERLAHLHAHGGTPMDVAIRMASERFRKEGIDRLVIITDGDPNSVGSTRDEISKLLTAGIKVMFLGVRRADLFKMEFMLGNAHRDWIEFIEEVQFIPDAFFRLLQRSI
jgi:hypothetical protein